MVSGVQAELSASGTTSEEDDSGPVVSSPYPYADVDAVVWRPVHEPAARVLRVRIWAYASLAVAVAVVAGSLAWAIAAHAFSPGLLGVLAAVAAGVLLLGAGLGHLEGEALAARAARIAPPVAPTGAEASFLGDGTRYGTTPLNSEVLRALRDGPRGLTSGRAAVFAGTFLLAVAAVCGTILLAAAPAGAGPAGPAARVPAASVSPTPAVSTPAASASATPTASPSRTQARETTQPTKQQQAKDKRRPTKK